MLDEAGVRVFPRARDQHIFISVNEQVKGTPFREQRHEGDGAGDLPDDGGNLPHDFFLRLLRLKTLGVRGGFPCRLHTKDPPFQHRIGFHPCHHHDQLLDIARGQPFTQLRQHIVQVPHQPFLLGDVQGQAIFCLTLKVLWGVDPALVQDACDGMREEFDDDVRGPAQGDGAVVGGGGGAGRGGGGGSSGGLWCVEGGGGRRGGERMRWGGGRWWW